MSMLLSEILALLGKELDNSEVQNFIKTNAPYEEYSDELAICYTFDKDGIGINIDNFKKVVTTIFFYNDPKSSVKSYAGTLPKELGFSMSQEIIRNRLGIPNRSKEGYVFRKMKWNAWDKYYFDKYDIHIQYNEDKSRIEMITIMTPDAVKHKEG